MRDIISAIVKAVLCFHWRVGNWSNNVTCYCNICESSDNCTTDGTCYADVFRVSESDESYHRTYGYEQYKVQFPPLCTQRNVRNVSSIRIAIIHVENI